VCFFTLCAFVLEMDAIDNGTTSSLFFVFFLLCEKFSLVVVEV